MATPTTSEFLAVPINGTDLIAFYRGSNISRPLYLRYSTFLDILSQSIGGGATLLLETNGVQNPSQTLLNLIQGSGITITDNGSGGVTIAATGGASFITSITDTADIDLSVTSSALSALLTTTGVTPNTYGSSTQVPQITVDSKGRITGVTLVNITAGTGSVTNVSASVPSPTTPALSVTVTNPTTTPAIAITANGTTGQYVRGDGSLATLPTAVTSVGLTMPSAFSVAGSPILTSGTLAVTGAGTTSQYVRGDGSLANFPTSGGGGSSINYYLNGSVSQGTFGGVAFKQMSRTAIFGAGTNFTINTNGYIQSFITDANDPNQLAIPAGNWNFEMYFAASSGGGSPSFYVELYKWDGATLTLIASSSANPEGITNGTAVDLYTTALAVPSTVLVATDRLAVRVWVNNSGRTITLHTEDSNLCEIITTFSTGLTALNGLTDQVQYFATPGTSGTAPNWNSVSPNHTLNIPLASAASVTAGLISKTDFDVFSAKLSPTLANTNIFVGNVSNVATAVAMSGDATIANTGALTIANNAVTYAKMQAVSTTSKLLGSSSTTTPVQEITIGGGLTLTGTTLTASFLITYRRLTSSSTLDSTDLTNVNTGVTYIIEMNVGTANTLTVPLNATIGFSIGSQITISQYGAGQTTIAAAVGVTLRSPGSFLKLAAQYSMCTLMKVDTNEWYVVGQLAP
jgi:hypothetical protein